MLCAGDIREDSQVTAHLFERMDILIKDHTLRQRMTERMQTLVDGNGAVRLARMIAELLSKNG